MREQVIDNYKYIVTTLDEMKCYVTCPLMYYLRYVLKWKEEGRQLLTLEDLYFLLMRDTIRYYFSRHTSLRMIVVKEMLAHFKVLWYKAYKKWRVCDVPKLASTGIIQRAVSAIELFTSSFRMTGKGYNHYRAVTSNCAYDVPIGGGVKITGIADAVLLRHYMEPEQTIQLVHICNKKLCPTEVDERLIPFYENVVQWMFGERLDSVLLFDMTVPSGTTKGRKVTEQDNKDAITIIRNIASSMYIDSIYPRAAKSQCLECAYHGVCGEHSLRDLLLPK